MRWETLRNKFLRDLERELLSGKVDEEIVRLLEIINSSEDFFTTSSCSGRIVLIDVPENGDKKRAKVLKKWHREVSVEEITSSIRELSFNWILWFSSQQPIIDVSCKSLEGAIDLIKIGVASGFKDSCIKSISENRVVVEIRTSEKLYSPIGYGGRVLIGESELELLVRSANLIQRRGKNRLRRLTTSTEKYIKERERTER